MNQDWLSQLAPAHAPPPPGWWPPAPGWWLLAAVLLLALVALGRWLRRPRRRLRRLALRRLRALENAVADDAQLARELELLLRRYAVARFGRAATARLAGPAWIDFVVAHGGRDLDGDAGRALLSAAYGGSAPPDRRAWLAGARGFLRGAR